MALSACEAPVHVPKYVLVVSMRLVLVPSSPVKVQCNAIIVVPELYCKLSSQKDEAKVDCH